jgi:hypothetical protein
MSLNLNALIDHVEILFITTFTTTLSGVNHFMGKVTHLQKSPQGQLINNEINSVSINTNNQDMQAKLNWAVINQALVSLITWMILGIAVGFLIGMLIPR